MLAHVEVNGLRQPFMFLDDICAVMLQEPEAFDATIGEYARNINDLCERTESLLSRMGDTAYYVRIRDIGHDHFTDITYLNSDGGERNATIHPSVALSRTSAYTRSYFLKYLTGEKTSLLHPDVMLETFETEQYLND